MCLYQYFSAMLKCLKSFIKRKGSTLYWGTLINSCLLACISVACWLFVSHCKSFIDALFCMTVLHGQSSIFTQQSPNCCLLIVNKEDVETSLQLDPCFSPVRCVQQITSLLCGKSRFFQCQWVSVWSGPDTVNMLRSVWALSGGKK